MIMAFIAIAQRNNNTYRSLESIFGISVHLTVSLRDVCSGDLVSYRKERKESDYTILVNSRLSKLMIEPAISF